MMGSHKWLTRDEAAERLGVPPFDVSALTVCGQIEKRSHGQRRYKASDVEALVIGKRWREKKGAGV